MSGISIGATATKVAATSSAQSGSPTQRAYERAVKQLTDAQQKLSQDTTAKASEDTLKTDQAAVQLAQIAVQAATAELARERNQSTSDSASGSSSVKPDDQAWRRADQVDVLA